MSSSIIVRGTCRERGFTLVEMMIVVAIIGILGAIAYPAYTKQVMRSKRSDAQTVLLEAAQALQRLYVARNSFVSTEEARGLLERLGLDQAPKGVDHTTYTVSVDVIDNARGFELTAVPEQTDSDCGSLTLDHRGAKGATAGDTADCWK